MIDDGSVSKSSSTAPPPNPGVDSMLGCLMNETNELRCQMDALSASVLGPLACDPDAEESSVSLSERLGVVHRRILAEISRVRLVRDHIEG